MTDRELMQQALEALEAWNYLENPKPDANVIAALRAAIEQAQEPVCDKDPQGCWSVRCQLGKICKHTAPRQWKGLTDQEIWSDGSTMDLSEDGIRNFARAIEAKLKEKNT